MARRVVGQGLTQALTGLAPGLPIAFALARPMSSVMFGVTSHDPLTFMALPVLIVMVSMAASSFPARWAARVDPVLAMRDE